MGLNFQYHSGELLSYSMLFERRWRGVWVAESGGRCGCRCDMVGTFATMMFSVPKIFDLSFPNGSF
jgi:hypothetical protein